MKIRLVLPGSIIGTLVISAIALASVVWVVAQSVPPSTESYKDESQIQPASFTSDMLDEPGMFPPDDNQITLDSSAAMAKTFSYYFVSGAELQPRSTAFDQVYGANGCVYMSSGSGTNLLTGTGLHMPDSCVIKYIRLYFNDLNASAGVYAFLTRYSPGSGTVDLVSAGSTNAFNGGYGYVVSSEITETVNNTSYAYMLYGWPDSATNSLQVCGIRVAYYAPSIFGVALPLVRK